MKTITTLSKLHLDINVLGPCSSAANKKAVVQSYSTSPSNYCTVHTITLQNPVNQLMLYNNLFKVAVALFLPWTEFVDPDLPVAALLRTANFSNNLHPQMVTVKVHNFGFSARFVVDNSG